MSSHAQKIERDFRRIGPQRENTHTLNRQGGEGPPLGLSPSGLVLVNFVVTRKQHSLQVDSGVEEPRSLGDPGQERRRDGALRR